MYVSVSASLQSKENCFSKCMSFCNNEIVSGLLMSCGFNVKNNDAQSDHKRRAKNLGSQLSFSASEPRTFRYMICICRKSCLDCFFETLPPEQLANAVYFSRVKRVSHEVSRRQ